MRILLIDDSAAYEEEFAILLADAKIRYSVLDRVATAAEGAGMLAAGAHDVYIVDYRLPGGDGLDLVRDARKAGLTKPIIVLTGYGNPKVDIAAEEAGATDYLPKGEFSAQTLDRAIRYAVRNADAVRQAKETASLFRMAQEAAEIGAWEWDISANTHTWSARMREMYGVGSGEEATYGRWYSALHPDDRDAVQAALASAVGGFARFDTTYRVHRSDPATPDAPPIVRWHSIKGELMRDANGAPLRMAGVNVDVTEQQNAVAALQSRHSAAASSLRASETRFQTYFEASSECLFHMRIDPDGQFRYEAVNPAGLAHAGILAMPRDRTPEEVLGPRAGGQMVEALRQVQETGLPYHYEPTFDLPSGPVTFDAVYMPLRDACGIVTGVLGSARDITERRRLEAQLHQSQKMEALGQLAGGVAHDFNNLLTGILGCFEMLGRQVTSERGKRLVAQGCKAVEHSTALTARLLAFSRHEPLTTQPVDINRSLEEMTEMLARTLGSDVRIGKDLTAELWRASTDRNQFELAILNLAINARDAMPLGGSLTISTRNQTLLDPRDGLMAGDYVSVAVTDVGGGMPPELLTRVLEPFFTTKELGKGTGLGLSMVADVTRQLGGGLIISSEVGKGTCVTLFLPRARVDAPALPSRTSTGAPSWSMAPACILLVDDDQDTRTAVSGYAAAAGHQVVAANSGSEALALLDAGRAVDIMVIDDTLPGVPTAEVIAQSLVRRPGMPVLVLSGQTTQSATDGFPVLAKPFRQEQFNVALTGLLERAPGSSNVVHLRQSLTG
ncbi:MAG: hypothetical protein QOG73_2109 [Acetobacteraceae bacterium]|jgi:signal transduction histidine kinase/DNA-binding response OmpR family regulator|nr:hypothetical protein [Acetobacteraceae bacterium]